MTQPEPRRRTRKAALLQLAAEVVRASARRDRDARDLVRTLERSAAREMVAPRRDPAAAV
jgi:hypothetical protein